jgi:hypothetical protein
MLNLRCFLHIRKLFATGVRASRPPMRCGRDVRAPAVPIGRSSSREIVTADRVFETTQGKSGILRELFHFFRGLSLLKESESTNGRLVQVVLQSGDRRRKFFFGETGAKLT